MIDHKDLQNPNAFPGTDARGFGSIGMSLRDYFAASALNGAVAAYFGSTCKVEPLTPDTLASMAYATADAMLAERMKDQ